MTLTKVFQQLRSDVVGLGWPSMLTGETAALFSTLFALDQTERLPSEDLARLQDGRLESLLRHASLQVPFYADRLRAAGYRAGRTPVATVWDTIPLLTRTEIQNAGDSLRAKTIPASHGAIHQRSTSGSTNRPVRIATTGLTDFHWKCLNLRDRVWHDIDLGGTLVLLTDGASKIGSKPYLELGSWSLPATSLRNPGRQFKVNPTLKVEDQVRTIRKIDPAYIHTRPSQLNLLLKHCERSGERFERLRAVFCLSEVLPPDLREACRRIFDVPIIDCYSCAEAGYLALQCPEQGKLHVQSEMVRVEILNAEGRACRPGEIGRVVVTSLHNYAMPLIRYEIGDEAEVGERCACGRGLPVIARVIGRAQDYLKLRSGEVARANIRHYEIARNPAIVEFQVVQRDWGRLEIILVAHRPLNESETLRMKTIFGRQGDEMFDVDITYRDRIERPESGKLRSFVCEVV